MDRRPSRTHKQALKRWLQQTGGSAPHTEASAQPATRGWLTGVSQAVPIVLGYVPIGLTFGVLAQKAGISGLNTVLMSLLVYAGASQFIAAGLFAAGVPPLSIVLTTFVANLRHLLMAASLVPYLDRWRRSELAAFAYQLTDETFAVHTVQFGSGAIHKADVFWVNAIAQVAWVSGSWLGVVGGQFVADPGPWGLDYALPAMFVALLVLQIKDRIQIVVALATGLLAVLLSLWGLEQWVVILSTLAGATLGVGLERWIKRPSP